MVFVLEWPATHYNGPLSGTIVVCTLAAPTGCSEKLCLTLAEGPICTLQGLFHSGKQRQPEPIIASLETRHGATSAKYFFFSLSISLSFKLVFKRPCSFCFVLVLHTNNLHSACMRYLSPPPAPHPQSPECTNKTDIRPTG